MEKFKQDLLKDLYKPQKESHKGQNGKLMIIGGSHLFHGASLFALKVASRIVDMVFYASTLENNKLTEELKEKIYDFIAVPREKIDDYISEADCILMGSGLPREEGREDGEELTKELAKRYLSKYPDKRWVLDAGAITEIEPEWLLKLNGNVILTPHHKEFERLFNQSTPIQSGSTDQPINPDPIGVNRSTNQPRSNRGQQMVGEMAKKFHCTILLKGEEDVVCSPSQCVQIEGGNEGMTKGGTGDVLAGLVAALSCKNDLFLAASAASFINKKAGESLYKTVGPYFNASDLADEIPKIMNKLIINQSRLNRDQQINK